MQTSRAFLLSYVQYGDFDAVLHCFSQEQGYESYFSKNIFRPKNKNRACLFALNELSLVINRPKTGKMPNVSKMEVLKNLYLDFDIKRQSLLMFSAEFLNQILRDENQNELIYNEVKNFSEALVQDEKNPHLALMVRMLKINGLSPLHEGGDYLDPESGKFSEDLSHELFNKEISTIWRQFLSSNEPYLLPLTRPLRKQFLESLLIYYRLHFNNFRTPKSLDVFSQVFE